MNEIHDCHRRVDLGRRRLLRYAIAVPSAAAIASSVPWLAHTVRAEVVTAVIAVIQIAIAMSKMFGKSGPSIVDLLTLQTEMLRTISLQLVVVQKGIVQILTELADLKRLIGEVPGEVIAEQYRSDMQGLLANFNKALNTSDEIKRNKGIEEARRYLRNRMRQQIVPDVRKIRFAMSQRSTPIAFVPSMAAALLIELQTIIHKAGAEEIPKEEVDEILDAYEDWFTAVKTGLGANSLAGRLDTLRVKRAELVKEANGRRKDIICQKNIGHYHRQVTLVKGGKEQDPIQYYEYDLTLVGHVRKSLFSVGPLTALPKELQDQFALLVQEGMLRKEDAPLSLTETRSPDAEFQLRSYEHEEKGILQNTSTHPQDVPARGHVAIHHYWEYELPKCNDALLDPWVEPHSVQRDALIHMNYQFITLGSMNLVSRECLTTIANFRKAREIA